MKFPSSIKRCATCTYWSGERKPNAGRNLVETSDSMELAECIGGKMNRRKFNRNGMCDGWEKWGSLR